jgi:tetratricopeptide (TPR) repeat protein
MRWLQAEYVLKGIYLGLLVFVALQDPDWRSIGLVALCTFGGLALCLGIAVYRKWREGYQVRGRLLPFLLFLLLESPSLVYAGILGGMAVGALAVRRSADESALLGYTVGGGALLGVAFWVLRQVRQRWVRLGASLVVAAALVTVALLLFGLFGDFNLRVALPRPDMFGFQLLLGIPAFYLLAFSGREEESEVEIGAMCAALGVSLGLLAREHPSYISTGLLVCLMLYVFYTTRVLPGLRVFKHALRGLSYTRVGRHRQALLAFRRALQLDPQCTLAREGMWAVHRSLDPAKLADEPQTLALIDLDLCLERVAALLLEPGPGPAKLVEANRLLDLVLSQQPARRSRVHYWRAVAHTHARQYDRAAAELALVLDPAAYAVDDTHRRSVLLQAWQLALLLHPELNRRCGTPQLTLPGRRMDAIGAVERHLAASPDDATIWDLKRLLYSGLTEAEYVATAGENVAAADFDHGYVQQLGLALINDPVRWERGGEYLRIAVRGLPALGPSLFTQIAQAQERAGHAEEALRNYELAKVAGRAVGPKNLADDERQTYFAVVKLLAEKAVARGDLHAAIENYHLCAESERSGLETLRTLAGLYERVGDPLLALRVTEQALLYNAKDKDLLERKDRYYYSVMPDDLRRRLDLVRHGFDVDYCLRKARTLLDTRGGDLDLLDWAEHLLRVAEVVQPDSLTLKVLLARARLRRGERDEAVALLESVRSPKPEKFAGDDQEAWYVACRLLGELYLYELARPDLAVPCFNDFRNSSKSGADTMYKLGQAYEQLGDTRRAVKCYESVTAYDGHPLAPDAREALYRLQAPTR